MVVSAMRLPRLGCAWTLVLMLVCVVGLSTVKGKTLATRNVAVNPAIPITGLRAIAPKLVSLMEKSTPIVVLMKHGNDVTVTLSEDGKTLMSRHIDYAFRRPQAHRPLFRLPVSQGGQRHLTVTARNRVSSASVDLYVSEIMPITQLNMSVATHGVQSILFGGSMNDATSVMCIHAYGDNTVGVAWAPRGGDAATTLHMYASPGAYRYSMSCYNYFSKVDHKRAIYIRPTRKPVIVIESLALPGGLHDAHGEDPVVVTPGEPLRITYVANIGRSEPRCYHVNYDDSNLTLSYVSSDDLMTFSHKYDHEGNYTVIIHCHSNKKKTQASKTVIVKEPRDQVEDSAPTDDAKTAMLSEDNEFAVASPMSADDEELTVDVSKNNVVSVVQ